MKKSLYIIAVAFVTIGLMSLQWKKNQYNVLDKSAIISCLNMETQQAYQLEASQKPFANMHPNPIKVNAENLLGEMIKYPSSDGKNAQGYFIKSKKKSDKWLIVVQEWWGLNDNIKLESDKYYTALGDVNVIAVDMYDGSVAATPDSAMKLMRGANMERMTSIINATISHVGKGAKIYTLGWCFGGMWSLQTAILAGSQAKGCVMYYGRPETNLEKLKSIQCDVIGFFGSKDKSPSPEMVDEFEKNMQSVDKKLTRYNYDAGHGFANPSNPSFVAAARDDAYEKTIAFLKSH
jgi:carboxymethylenebutenolidase